MQLCKDECEVLQARTCSKEVPLLRERLGSSLAEEIIPNCARLARDCDEGKYQSLKSMQHYLCF